MTKTSLQLGRVHLSSLLEAIQRCVFFLDASEQKLLWPLSADYLEQHKKDVAVFESLAAINERFAKLQDTLGVAMRHAILLAGEPCDSYLKVLSFYEKLGVIESIDSWQLCRITRNLAAHDYGTDYAEIAGHFNALHTLIPRLYAVAGRFLAYCQENLSVLPINSDFIEDFSAIVTSKTMPRD